MIQWFWLFQYNKRILTRDPSVLQNDERPESNIILYAISSKEYKIYHACLFIASESMNT